MFSCPPRIPVERTLVQSNTLQPQKETENDGAATRQSQPPPPGADEFRRDLFRLSPSPDLGCALSFQQLKSLEKQTLVSTIVTGDMF